MTTQKKQSLQKRFAIYNRSSEIMSELENESIDLAITDPPFNIGLTFGQRVDDTSHGNYLALIKKVILETQRVLKPTGLSLILLPTLIKKQGRVHNYPQAYKMLCEYAGLSLIETFPFRITEEDFSCVPLSNFDSPKTPENSHTQEMNGLVFGKLPCQLKSFPTERSYKYVQSETHPCPYPRELIKDILDTYFSSTNVVLDPFMGTGRLGEEVLKRGGFFRGYEIDPSYFNIVQKRLEVAERGVRR